CQQSYHPPFTF
nr:immunoglobulin light chain junction region [Macaca mulatta]